MTYEEIIKNNCENNSDVKWWPRFAYHYTDITNAVEILNCGKLYSRANAREMGVMHNDNASRQVIDMTQTAATSSVRFYFRPLTPTQYHNEGFKHAQLRYDRDENANVPVPIFFVFDLVKLLKMPKVTFSEKGQAGHGSALLQSGEDAFSKLDFKNIYANGPVDPDTMQYRHAEILCPSELSIDDCIKNILCRNDIERISLLNMIRNRNQLNYRKYQNIIKVCKTDMFEKNGLFISDCRYYDSKISITFSDYNAKQAHTLRMKKNNGVRSLKPITLRVELDWLNTRSHIEHSSINVQIDYETARGLVFQGVPQKQNAKFIRIKVFIENALMCFVEYPLESSEVIK